MSISNNPLLLWSAAACCRFILPRACSRRGPSADLASRGQHHAKARKCRPKGRRYKGGAPGQQAGLCESGSKLPHSKALQLTVLAYLLPPVKRHRVRFGHARGGDPAAPGVIRAGRTLRRRCSRSRHHAALSAPSCCVRQGARPSKGAWGRASRRFSVSATVD